MNSIQITTEHNSANYSTQLNSNQITTQLNSTQITTQRHSALNSIALYSQLHSVELVPSTQLTIETNSTQYGIQPRQLFNTTQLKPSLNSSSRAPRIFPARVTTLKSFRCIHLRWPFLSFFEDFQGAASGRLRGHIWSARRGHLGLSVSSIAVESELIAEARIGRLRRELKLSRSHRRCNSYFTEARIGRLRRELKLPRSHRRCNSSFLLLFVALVIAGPNPR